MKINRKFDKTFDFHLDFYFVITWFSHVFAAFWRNLSFIWTFFSLSTNHRSALLEWYEFLKKKIPSNPRVRRSTNENYSELMKIIEMLREILIFSAGFVFGLLVVLDISNFEVIFRGPAQKIKREMVTILQKYFEQLNRTTNITEFRW